MSNADRQKAYRARKRNAVTDRNAAVTSQRNADRNVTLPVTDRNADRNAVTPVTRNAHDHEACHRELALLRLDVERLKGELAAAHTTLVPVRRIDAVGVRGGKASIEQMVPRGDRGMDLYSRLRRSS